MKRVPKRRRWYGPARSALITLAPVEERIRSLPPMNGLDVKSAAARRRASERVRQIEREDGNSGPCSFIFDHARTYAHTHAGTLTYTPTYTSTAIYTL